MVKHKHLARRQLTQVERFDLKVAKTVALDDQSGRGIAVLREYVDERPLLTALLPVVQR